MINYLALSGAVAVALLVVFHCSAARAENSTNVSRVPNYANNRNNTEQQANKNTEMSSKSQQQSTTLTDSQAIFQPLIEFTSSLFDKIRSDDNNVILSPLSIHAALNLLTLGAEPNTVTYKELLKALRYPDKSSQEQLEEYHKAYKNVIEKFKDISKVGMEALKRAESKTETEWSHSHTSDKPPIVDFYNTIIIKRDKPLLKQYSERSSKYYNSTVEQIDQSKPETVEKVCDKINKWGKDAGFEKDILNQSEFFNNFSTMLLSAVRVQAFWFDESNEFHTKGVFYNHGLKDRAVDGKRLSMSYARAKFFEFCNKDQAEYKQHYQRVNYDSLDELKVLNFRALEIPLQGEVSLVIFEPKDNGQGKELGELAQKLLETSSSQSKLAKVLQVMDQSDSYVTFEYIAMPRFGFENDIDLIDPLKSLGINEMFDDSSSELRQIIQNEPVYVDKAKHQAMIEVNKFGLKAAGVTKIRMVALSSMHSEEYIRFELKKPFIFMIRYERVPLFIGQLVKLDK